MRDVLYLFIDGEGEVIGIGTMAEFDALKADGILADDCVARPA